jgi:hypothetical protein
MNVLSFKYTKKDKDISNRVFIPLATPNGNSYFGVDISELEPVDQVTFAQEMQAIEDARFDLIEALMEKNDIAHNFRNFLPAKMSELIVEEI